MAIPTNISPIQPTNNPGPSFRPLNLTPMGGGELMRNKPKSAFDRLDAGKIGKGRLMIDGSYHKRFGEKSHYGLKGQLAGMAYAGRHGITKNLSPQNLEKIYDLIAGRLKKKMAYSATSFSRKDKMGILTESRKLVKQAGSNFTYEDRKDLIKIVNTLQQQFKDRTLHRGDRVASTLMTQPLLTEEDFIGLEQTRPVKPDNIAGGNKLPSKPKIDDTGLPPDNSNN